MNRYATAAAGIAGAALLALGLGSTATAAAAQPSTLNAQVCAAVDLAGVNAVLGTVAVANLGALAPISEPLSLGSTGSRLQQAATLAQVRQLAGCSTTTPTPTTTPAPTTTVTPEPTGEPEPTDTVEPTTTPPVAEFDDCADVRAAGRAPLVIGDPDYRAQLDSDRDGLACEFDQDAGNGSNGTGSRTDGDSPVIVVPAPTGAPETGA